MGLADITQQAGADKLIGGITGKPETATIPPPENISQRWFFGEEEKPKLRQMMAALERDCTALGEEFLDKGRRLATPARGGRAVRQNKFAQSQDLLERALAAAPGNPDVLCQLGLVCARRGEMEKAVPISRPPGSESTATGSCAAA